MTITAKDLIQKYGETIKEEVNVKDIQEIDSSMKITKIFKPIGSQISPKFGKDTGKIIQYGKQGNIKEAGNDKVIVFDNDGNERTLESTEYEIAYEGLEENNTAIDGNIIAKMELELTPELQKEGIAREISRFLNQMRKDANFNVDDKVQAIYFTTDEYLQNILQEFKKFLKHEALISEFVNSENPEGDIVALFTNNETNINFALKR